MTPPSPIAHKNSLFKINRLFSINLQIFGLKHAVYMSIKEFLSKKRQLPLGSKSEGKGGGGAVLKHLCFWDRYREQENNGDDMH